MSIGSKIHTMSEEQFKTALSTMQSEINKKIADLTKNVTDGFDTVSKQCLGWFNQLKSHVEANSTTITSIKKEMQDLRKHNAVLKQTCDDLKTKVENLQEDADYKTEHAFRLQLVVYNVPETDNEDTHRVLTEFMVTQLHIPPQQIEYLPIRDTHRIGKVMENRTRPILVAFLVQRDRDYVLKHGKELRNTNFSIEPHLSKRQWTVKKSLLAKRATIKAGNRNALAFIGYRSYKPVLLVKVNGQLREFKNNMDLASLQAGDNGRRWGPPEQPPTVLHSAARVNLMSLPTFAQPDTTPGNTDQRNND